MSKFIYFIYLLSGVTEKNTCIIHMRGCYLILVTHELNITECMHVTREFI